METVDPDISATCNDLGAVKKVFQLALLCTKKQPSDRPTMHVVSRVLGSLVQPSPPPKQQQLLVLPAPSSAPSNIGEYINSKHPNALTCTASLSDALLFLKFGEVISQNTE